MRYYSETTQREYDDNEMVFFRNIRQSIAYIEMGATVYDVFVDGRGKLVFCFLKTEHNRLKSVWGTKENNNMNVKDNI